MPEFESKDNCKAQSFSSTPLLLTVWCLNQEQGITWVLARAAYPFRDVPDQNAQFNYSHKSYLYGPRGKNEDHWLQPTGGQMSAQRK